MMHSSDVSPRSPSHTINVDNYGAVAVARTGAILITTPGHVTINNPGMLTQNTTCQSPSEVESEENQTRGFLLTVLSLVLALEYALPPPDDKSAGGMQAWHICNGLTFFALLALAIVAALTWSELRHYYTNSTFPKYLLKLSGAMTIVGGITRLILTRHIDMASIGYSSLIMVGIVFFSMVTWCFRNRATAHALATRALGPAPTTPFPAAPHSVASAPAAPAPATLGPAGPTPSAALGPAPATPDSAAPAPTTLGLAAPTPSATLGPAPAGHTPFATLGPASAAPAPDAPDRAAPAPTTLGLAAPTPSATLGPAPTAPAPATLGTPPGPALPHM
ncbi:IgGFc-binding protein-like protein [Carex littledalei]|uniref:IgGFc-binding protein-like protein n=1 Tax=Carex littledalei TaxID=544730 RepID=A0A833QF17_9POAL|nr:IgGFc-binding protein-like protein [Carex littledalei]